MTTNTGSQCGQLRLGQETPNSRAFSGYVRFWHKADITTVLNYVRFWVQSGHRARGASMSAFDPNRTLVGHSLTCGWNHATPP
jgi:hypothetical protein